MKALIRFLKRYFCRHNFTIIRPVSNQSALVTCSKCKREYVLVMQGEHEGRYMPWAGAAEDFYKWAFPKLNRQNGEEVK